MVHSVPKLGPKPDLHSKRTVKENMFKIFIKVVTSDTSEGAMYSFILQPNTDV